MAENMEIRIDNMDRLDCIRDANASDLARFVSNMASQVMTKATKMESGINNVLALLDHRKNSESNTITDAQILEMVETTLRNAMDR